VSNTVKVLDKEVAAYHSKALTDTYQYLFLDGIVLKARNAIEVKKRFVLTAYGITHFGHKELISFRQAKSESENEWTKFLTDLYKRGLKGESLKLVIVDGCPGLLKAIDMTYPYVPIQRCWVHKLRNIASYLPEKYFDCLKEAKAIYLAENKKEAVKVYWTWAKKYRDLTPKAVNCLEKDIDEMFAFLNFPKSHQIKIRTTNPQSQGKFQSKWRTFFQSV
jgi:transposase-like protein